MAGKTDRVVAKPIASILIAHEPCGLGIAVLRAHDARLFAFLQVVAFVVLLLALGRTEFDLHAIVLPVDAGV
jgi:hypothetical protein